MSCIQLLRIGDVEEGLLQELCKGLTAELRAPCEVLPDVLDPAFAFHPERGQYYSTELLARMGPYVSPRTWRLLGVASVDLYIPILTFVFGEAQVGDSCAIVSFHRLRQEFYGLPAEPFLLSERLLKEAVHELGHTFELSHCDDYRCAMAPSHAVERIDVKTSSFCPACRSRILASRSDF
jgi:archaemetzincin